MVNANDFKARKSDRKRLTSSTWSWKNCTAACWPAATELNMPVPPLEHPGTRSDSCKQIYVKLKISFHEYKEGHKLRMNCKLACVNSLIILPAVSSNIIFQSLAFCITFVKLLFTLTFDWGVYSVQLFQNYFHRQK